VSIYDEPKIDCHNHVFDPARFPYATDTIYRPSGAELGTPAQIVQTFDAYGVQHALIVGPNSGYNLDNRCLVDTLARNAGRFRGIAVVRNDVSRTELEALKAEGIEGCAINPALYGVEPYREIDGLLQKLAELKLFAQVQVRDDQLLSLLPALERSARCSSSVAAVGRSSSCRGTSNSRASAIRMPIPDRMSMRSSMPLRSTGACGARTGLFSARRSMSITDRC
jgi:predicted TIM-barrel fold metal-dependent hydrolase